MGQTSWNSWNLLSFTGLQISHGRGPEKHSLKGIVSKIFDGVRKGWHFVHLWGEERALRLRTVTSGQCFNWYTCLVKSQKKPINMGIQRAFGVVTYGGDMRVLCSLRRGDSYHLHSTFPHRSHYFTVPRFILSDNMSSVCEGSSCVWSSDLLSYWTWRLGNGTFEA